MFRVIIKTFKKLNLGKILTVLGVLYAIVEIAHALQRNAEQDKTETAKSVLNAIKKTV